MLFIKNLILPPSNFFIFIFLSLILKLNVRSRVRFVGNLILTMSLLCFYFVSTPKGAQFFVSPLQEKIVPLSWEGIDADAIVILGAGQKENAREYQKKATVSSPALIRIAYGAYLQKRIGIPILVSGGSQLNSKESEALVMARTLREIFSASVKWLEEKSQNTAENALYSSEFLKKDRVKKILLVTEALHMKRALLSFRSSGLQVIAAPTNFYELPLENSVLDWIPDADSIRVSRLAMHEWLGYFWYSIIIP